jgi:hypothetical protein
VAGEQLLIALALSQNDAFLDSCSAFFGGKPDQQRVRARQLPLPHWSSPHCRFGPLPMSVSLDAHYGRLHATFNSLYMTLPHPIALPLPLQSSFHCTTHPELSTRTGVLLSTTYNGGVRHRAHPHCKLLRHRAMGLPWTLASPYEPGATPESPAVMNDVEVHTYMAALLAHEAGSRVAPRSHHLQLPYRADRQEGPSTQT